jgi:hypothetical protein
MTSASKGTQWAGRVLSGLVMLALGLSGIMKVVGAQQVMENFTGKFGYPAGAVTIIGIIELLVMATYAFPRTRILGAILVTGYLGGAIATHTRIGDPSLIAPLLLGVFAWGGLYLRNDVLRTLLPLVR